MAESVHIIFSTIVEDIFGTYEKAEDVARSDLDGVYEKITNEMIDDRIDFLMQMERELFDRHLLGVDEGRDNQNVMYLVTADIGAWDGHHKGGKFFPTLASAFSKIAESVTDYKVVEDFRGGVMVYGYHHDGMNKYKIRELTPAGISYVQNHWHFSQEILHDKIANNNRYSRNLRLRKLFGWVRLG